MRTTLEPSDLREFSQKHGSPVKLPGRWLFSDGAIAHVGDWGINLEEPSDDPLDRRALLACSREWYLARLAKVQTDFFKLKAALLGSGTFQWPADESIYGAPPPDVDKYTGQADGLPALKRLQSFVLKFRSELETIDNEIASMEDTKKEAARRRLNERLDSEAEHRAEALQAEITAITI